MDEILEEVEDFDFFFGSNVEYPSDVALVFTPSYFLEQIPLCTLAMV